ncbi:hypothetical protein SBRCBS47491_004470 [Sporothrix bragantina]|uniref:Plac8 family protein n=1 Tax=Sporothrix bragantina TaxID=671064 RepID=A0ABP0BNS4_9PEZI
MADYKAPPQYSTPPPGQQSPYGGPSQYGSPAPQQAQAYPPQQQGVIQYGAPGQPQHPQYAQPQPQQFPQQQQQQQQPAPQHQYQAAAPMQRGVAPGGAASAPVGGAEWNASLMDCSPCDSCCLGTFLPCVLLGKTSDRMRDPTMQSADSMNSDCMVFTAIHCFTGCGWIYIMMKRGEIRERFGIAGSGGGDCCATYWCPCCALIQQDNEVKSRTQHMVNTQGYQAQAGMSMPQK